MGGRFQFRIGAGGPLYDCHADGYPARFTAAGRAGGGTVTGVVHIPTAQQACGVSPDDTAADPMERHRPDRFAPDRPAFWSFRKAAELMARHVKSWDVRDAEGFPVPVTTEAVLSLPLDVQEELLPVVLGYRGVRLLTQGPPDPPTNPDDAG